MVLKTNSVAETLVNVFTLLDGVSLFIVFDEIVAEFFAVAVIVHFAVDLYLIKMVLLSVPPVKASVVVFVSTTVPETLGLQLDEAAVTVSVHVFDPNDVLPLYVVQVIVQVPVLAFGICA